MREIKFRAVDEFTDDFIYAPAFFIDRDNNQGYLAYGISDHHLVKKNTVGQFTGLRDKNNNLGFEGDIVKIPDDWDKFGWMSGEIREIYFFDGCFRLKPRHVKDGRGHTIEDGFEDCEIIGNIHQNPELLK